ncbi:MAG: deoxyribonuclease IV [Acidimicrobiales bacterium]
MLIGAHVRAGGKLVPALERGDEIGAEVVQVFTQSPRAWKPTQYAPGVLEGYRAAQAAHPRVVATFCHATYLINLATADDELLERSRDCLAANLTVARDMGAAGLVLHIGSHKGLGFEGCVPQVVDSLAEALDLVGADCPILLENAAGAGGTMGRSFEELAEVLDRAAAGEGLGVCLDTQHLWASGVAFASVGEADDVLAAFDATIGLDRLHCLHLNDSKVPFGANRDRHANIGEGTIGARGLGALLGHPALQGLPAMLEVPGAGDGPRPEDVAAARKALATGLRLRR